MKKQITRLSPHQNAKVFSVLVAVGSLFFLTPMFLVFTFLIPPNQHGSPLGPSGILFLVFPIFYLIFGYLSVVIGCMLYNFFFKFLGGFEFESHDSDS